VSYLALFGTALVAFLGGAAIIEMLYHMQLNAGAGSQLEFFGATLDVNGFNSWFGALFVLVTGLGMFESTRRQFIVQWGEIQEYIEKEMKRRESL